MNFGNVVGGFLGLGVTLFGLACSSEASDGGSPQAVAPVVSAAGRWTLLVRFDWDDDADSGAWEVVEQDGLVTMRHCSSNQLCAKDWSCDPDPWWSGTAPNGRLHLESDWEKEGVSYHGELDVTVSETSMEGTLEMTPCRTGEASCMAVALGCRTSAGVRPECEGRDFTGLANCACIDDPACR